MNILRDLERRLEKAGEEIVERDKKIEELKEGIRELINKYKSGCACGREEWCSYCNPESPLNKIKTKLKNLIKEEN